MLTLWTIQPVEVMDIINKEGVFRCTKTLSDNYQDVCFNNAYDWLTNEMLGMERLAHPDGVELPLWAWHTYDGKCKKPDLRQSGYASKGTKCVCIEFCIEENKVLLSDFDIWHCVLNDIWYNDAVDEDVYYELDDWYDALPEEEQKETKYASWRMMYDVHRSDYVQATFWELRKEQIKKVQYFTAR